MRTALISVLPVAIAAACGSAEATQEPSDGRPVVHIAVGKDGYEPAEARAPAGKPVRLVFTRTSDEGCGQQLIVPSEKLRRDLPLREPVAVDLTMPASGKVAFTCGMDMWKGAVVAE